jgi:hypothetical protein
MRRAALLERAGTSLSDLRAKRDAYLLDLQGHALLDELEGVEYLLDGD